MRWFGALSGVMATFAILGVPVALFADGSCSQSRLASTIWINVAVLCLIVAASANCCCQGLLENGKVVKGALVVSKFALLTLPRSIGQMNCNPERPIALLISFTS